MATRDEELEKFKTLINLCEYAESLGFELDQQSSSRCSVVMKHPNHDKIVVARSSSRHWVYFNVHGGAHDDSGTIIDFVQARKKFTLGDVRKELRPWIGKSQLVKQRISTFFPMDLEPSVYDAARVLGNWINANRIGSWQSYLLNDRRIPSSVLGNPIFVDRLRTDQRSNVLFPHWDQHGSLCGYEVKNRGFTGFAPGGTKGLWCSRPHADDQIMVLAETAIDALSVAAIFGTEKKRFFSTAGQISPTQAVCIRSAVSQMPVDAEIWLAFDNDSGGRKLVQQVTDALAELSDNQRKVVVALPSTVGDDWNDVLRKGTCPGSPRIEND